MMAIYARASAARDAARRSLHLSCYQQLQRTKAMDQARNVEKIVTRFKNRVRGN
ncbi:hypothetical protein [Bradyrhizobium sp. SZCCHNRI20481]|uniref:hypothetical protein n=1 Tax=Bradyrhizobium sp. SZCCHNRI20481 TaxID=3057286 RepID=UPI0029168C9C|nr:hypothetical protein [Bradyrhizobium sp. SZCCHNRI20481]